MTLNCQPEMSPPPAPSIGDPYKAGLEEGEALKRARFCSLQESGRSSISWDASGTSTRTIPDSMRVRCVATQAGFSSGLVILPVSRLIFHAWRGQTTVLPVTIPSANGPPWCGQRDRKSTRLNSSHLVISYAVFCLKKKTTNLRTRVDRTK